MQPGPAAVVSFVIPVYNGERFIGDCLDAILREGGPGDEIIVVDNGSTDRTRAIVSGYPGVRLVMKADGSIGRVRNAGAALATGEILAFVDADCVLCRGWRAAVLAGLTDASVAAVGSRYDLPAQPGWIEEAWFAQKRRSPALVRYINSGNLAIRRGVFESIGGFDECLETGEDAELGWRLNAGGYRLREIPDVRAIHLGNPKDLGGFYRKQRWHGLGMLGTFRVSRFDKPLIMTGLFLLCLATAGALLLGAGGVPTGGTAWAVAALPLAVPVLTAAFRCLEFRRVGAFPPLVLLYLLYFTARLEAGGRLLLGAAARGRTPAGEGR